MKKLKVENLLKILVVILAIGGLVMATKLVYDNLSRATRVNPALVESYRPHLDTNLIQKAAETLQEKGKD